MNPRMRRLAFTLPLMLLLSYPLPSPAAQDPLDPGTGALQAVTPDGTVKPFPLQHTSADIVVSGLLARATVTQTFTNPFRQRIEAVYVFPLPENGAVDDMTMEIGSRTIRGKIKERQEANRIYEQAKRDGKTAGLLTQERPNLFTQAVANILPGDVIRITITYVQPLKYDAGTITMAFPMVVGPRYIPGAQTHPDGSVSGNPTIPDADRITPPVLRPGERSGHDIAVTVTMNAGVPFTALRSPSHRLVATATGPTTALVRLAPDDTIPNKDFVLNWDVRPERVATGLLTHRSEAGGFFGLTMVPAVDPRAGDVTAKEMVFLLDCSGSMSGAPIEQAKALVRHALGHLNPGDTFLIQNFSNTASGLAPRPLPNTPDNVRRGLAYLDTLHGEGGTEMLTGIRAALSLPADPERLRMVMFLTDGYIGNETQILSAVREKIADARLFSFGVGSSVNRYLLENLALEGRGAVQYVRYDEDAKAPVAKFYDQLRSPLLTDVEIDWAGLAVKDVYPARLPDLFAGHPLVVTGRFDLAGEAVVKVRGHIGGRRVEFPMAVTLPDVEYRNPVLRSLWARQAIEDRMRGMLRGEDPRLVRDVVDLSVTHRVLSQYTAFVAVEEKARTNERGQPVVVEQPVEIPDGVEFEGVFGDEDTIVAGFVKEERAYRHSARAMAPAPAARSGSLTRSVGAVSADAAGVALGTFGSISGSGAGGGGAGYGGIGLKGVGTVASAKPAEAKKDAAKDAPTLRLTVTSAPRDREKAELVLKRLLPRLRACIGGRSLGALTIRLATDGKGVVTTVVIEAPPAALDAATRACVVKLFVGAKLPAAGPTVVRLETR